MKKISSYFTLTSQAQDDQLVKQIGSKVIDHKIIEFPEEIGKGYIYFTKVIPGVYASLVNLSAKTKVSLTREKSSDDFFAIFYDMSNHSNLLKIKNKEFQIGTSEKPNLIITDNHNSAYYETQLNKKSFALQILVDKKLFPDFESHYLATASKDAIKLNAAEPFYGKADSKSTILLHSLKDKNIYDISFNSFITGITLKLVANLLSTNIADIEHDKIRILDKEAIDKTKLFLLSNLHNPFPTIEFLSNMARMSKSKYKSTFSKLMLTTPKKFFVAEKMNLAKELLTSGNYDKLSAVIYNLNYSHSKTLSLKYFEQFNKLPVDDFISRAS